MAEISCLTMAAFNVGDEILKPIFEETARLVSSDSMPAGFCAGDQLLFQLSPAKRKF